MLQPKIAIIGLEASGKTVLMTVLAKKLSQTVDEGYYLNPVGFSTIRYIENVWGTLQSGDWPPSTSPGEMFELNWKMQITRKFPSANQECSADVRLVDAAGQDMRQLFCRDTPLNDIPAYLQPLANYCAQADILIIALNIKDYVGESNMMRKTENQGAIKAALDSLHSQNKKFRVAFVFTQMDQYKALVDSEGGLYSFCQKEISYIYNAYIADNKNTVLGVAAVNDTEIRETEDAAALRVPVPNFSSTGLKEIGDWIAQQVVELSIQDRYDREEEDRRIAELVKREEEELKKKEKEENEKLLLLQPPKPKSSGCGVTLALLIIIGLIGLFILNGLKGLDIKIPDSGPEVTEVIRYNKCISGFSDCWSHHASITATIYNPGDSGIFRVTAQIVIDGSVRESQYMDINLESKRSKTCDFDFSNLNFCPTKENWRANVTVNRL